MNAVIYRTAIAAGLTRTAITAVLKWLRLSAKFKTTAAIPLSKIRTLPDGTFRTLATGEVRTLP
jgi:hypothetical protein